MAIHAELRPVRFRSRSSEIFARFLLLRRRLIMALSILSFTASPRSFLLPRINGFIDLIARRFPLRSLCLSYWTSINLFFIYIYIRRSEYVSIVRILYVRKSPPLNFFPVFIILLMRFMWFLQGGRDGMEHEELLRGVVGMQASERRVLRVRHGSSPSSVY